MKKKLVAFAVTAAMVVTSAVPVFAWQAAGAPGLDTSANQIVIDERTPDGIEQKDGVAGAITAGKTFKTIVDFNRTDGTYDFVVNMSNAAGDITDSVEVRAIDTNDRGYFQINAGNKSAIVKGIVELTWTFTGDGYFDVTVDELGNTANPEHLVDIVVPDGMEQVTSLLIEGMDSGDITSPYQAIIYQNQAPVDVVAVEVVKCNEDGTLQYYHGNPIPATQPVKGDYYRVNSITLDDGTVIGAADLGKYVDITWNAVKANGDVVYTGGTQNSHEEWFGVAANETKFDGCFISAEVKAKAGTGIFNKVVWGDEYEALAVQQRLAGANRYETAMEVADEMKPAGGFTNIFVATGENYADALSATALAAKMGAPILLVNEYYEDAVKDYIDANAANYGTTVYIVGGTGAVSQEFQDSIYKYVVNVERLDGADRYETNIAVLKAYDEIVAPNSGSDMRTVLVASGTDYPDALSASATGLPVLIVGDSLTKAQRDYLQDELAPVSGTTVKYRVTNYEIIGGRAAVSDDVKAELSEKAYIADADNVTRLSGSNRYATNKAVMDKYVNVTGDKYVFVASGNDFADALTGGVLAAQNGCALVLVNEYNTEFAKDIAEKVSANNANYGGLVVVGGEGAVSNATVQKIA